MAFCFLIYDFAQWLGWTGHDSSVGNYASWKISDTVMDHCIQHILSLRFGHGNISAAILPVLLIQEEQLSVNSERMYAKYW